MQEDAQDQDSTEGTMAASFRSPFALLEQRFTAASRVYTATDAGTIARSLIVDTQVTDGTIGLLQQDLEATVVRDQTYEYKQISDAVIELTNVEGGFDFEDAPIDSGVFCGAFSVFARQGSDLSSGPSAVVFEYGPGTMGNVQKVHRETRFPINFARVMGANGLIGEASDAGSIATYGSLMTVSQQSDVSDQDTLDAKAQALLRPAPIKVVEFTPEPAVSPQPWDDFWLGDTVRFRARHGAITEDLAVRINTIALAIDEDGNVATMTLTLDQDV